MDYTNFDFTNFSKGKWQEVLTRIQGKHHYVEDIKTYFYDNARQEIFPVVELCCVSDTEVDGFETYYLTFSAFDVKSNGRELDSATKEWRKFMFKKFGVLYRMAAIKYLQGIREKKVQEADEEYYRNVLDINN